MTQVSQKLTMSRKDEHEAAFRVVVSLTQDECGMALTHLLWSVNVAATCGREKWLQEKHLLGSA